MQTGRHIRPVKITRVAGKAAKPQSISDAHVDNVSRVLALCFVEAEGREARV